MHCTSTPAHLICGLDADSLTILALWVSNESLKLVDTDGNARVSPSNQPEKAPSASRMIITMGGFTASDAHGQVSTPSRMLARSLV